MFYRGGATSLREAKQPTPNHTAHAEAELRPSDMHRASVLMDINHMAQVVKNPPAMPETQETWVQSLGQEDPLEKEMATHTSTLAWEIPWAEEPGRLQSMGSQRVRHDRVHMPVDALSYPKDIKGNREMDSCPG